MEPEFIEAVVLINLPNDDTVECHAKGESTNEILFAVQTLFPTATSVVITLTL